MLQPFPDRFHDALAAPAMRAKLGLADGRPTTTARWSTTCSALLQAQSVDFTVVLPRAVGVGARRRDAGARRCSPTRPRSTRGRRAGARGSRPTARPAAIADAMDRVNPVYIPRNHLVEEALAAATAGDLEPFERLLDVLAQPVRRAPRPGGATPRRRRRASAPYQTFCGT